MKNMIANVYAAAAAMFALCLGAQSVRADGAPTPPNTQWTWTQNNSVVYLTETGIPEGQTPWKFKLTSGGALSVAAIVDSTSSKKINLRTIPTNCPYTITSTTKAGTYTGYFMNNGIAGNNSGQYSTAAGTIIEEIYLPDTLESLCQYAFANCTNLVVCDFTGNSQLTTIGQSAIYKCNKLKRLRLTENLETIAGLVNNASGIQACSKLQIDGPTLPNSLKTLGYRAFDSCPNAIQGRLTLGGADDHDLVFSNTPLYMFNGATGITEVVFGACVTKFASSYAFTGCTGITNIVCRNPNGFNFGTYFASLSNIKQYDFYGWPTGTLVTKNAETRILAPRDNAGWLALVNYGDDSVFKPWASLTDEQKQTYWDNFPSNDVENVLIPEGRVAGSSGSKTYEGCTIGYRTWVVFDKGETPVAKSLIVEGVVGDTAGQNKITSAAADGQTAFSPAYGYTHNVTNGVGTTVTCTAPRYAYNGENLYEITGYALHARNNATGGYSSTAAAEGTFSGDESRTFTFDAALYPETAYRLTWKMAEAGYSVTVGAPLLDGLLASSSVTGAPGACYEGGGKMYYLKDTEVTVTATAADAANHPFVMWGVKGDVANPTRFDPALKLGVTNAWTVSPVFKTDRWTVSGLTAVDKQPTKFDGTMTDGAWKFAVQLDNTTWKLTIKDAAMSATYSEALDWSKPVYDDGVKYNGRELYLNSVGCLAKRLPDDVPPNLRRISLGKNVTTVSADLFYDSKSTTDPGVCNLTNIVFESAPSIGAKAFYKAGALRNVAFRAGLPTESSASAFNGITPRAVAFTVPYDDDDWTTFANDSTKVTRWNGCAQEQKDAFFQYHPGERHPYGQTLSGNGTLPADQWLIRKTSGLRVLFQ